MAEDSPPISAELAATTPPKPYKHERIKGGKMPEIGPLVSTTIAEFTDNLVPYLLAGLGMWLFQMILIVIALPMMYALMFGTMIGGMLVSGGLGAAVGEASGDDDMAGLVASLGGLGSMILMMVVIFAFAAGLAAVTAPVGASLQRAVAAHQRGDKTLDFTAPFSTLTQDLPSVIGVILLYTVMILVGLMFCYIPGLAVALLFTMAPTMVYLHRKGAVESLAQAFAQVRKNPGPYLLIGLVQAGIGLVAAYIPVLGTMFAVALHVRAYREIYGDDDEPNMGSLS